jgi:hypothetical protein
MFQVTNNNFTRYLDLSNRVSNDVITPEYIRYFDNDGFELSYLEEEYYRENSVPLTYILNHSADQQEWMTVDSEFFTLDHCMISQRWQFVEEAKEQLEGKKSLFPQLNKYLNLVPKWGLDFALEYYKDDVHIEVLHFEKDYRNYYEATAAKEHLQNQVLKTDWDDFVSRLMNYKDIWELHNGMAQNDWKATFWGLNKAETTYKAFV